MIFVPGGDFGLEHELLEVAGAVPGEPTDTLLLDQRQQAARVEERTQPVGGHFLPALQIIIIIIIIIIMKHL